jgi:hypothetical protein
VLISREEAPDEYFGDLRQLRNGQFNGNHFTLGISVHGFQLALQVLNWKGYVRDERRFLDQTTGQCWNDVEYKNGYDMGKLMCDYLQQIGKPHLSFVEAVLEGEIEELHPLRKEVGLADAFFSHVQAMAMDKTVESLLEAEEQHGVELREDRKETVRLRQEALMAFLTTAGQPHLRDRMLGHFQDNWGALEEHLRSAFGDCPDFQSLRGAKPGNKPLTFFIDYFCIRQCLDDFTVPRVMNAIETIGFTVAELGTDWRDDAALLRRMFCVLELFATVKAKGQLLMCGPALRGRQQVDQLLRVATNKAQSPEVIDSRNTARYRNPPPPYPH